MKFPKFAKKREKISLIRLDLSHKNQVTALLNKILERQQRPLPWGYDEQSINKALSARCEFPALFGAFRQKELLSLLGIWRWTALPYATLYFRACKTGNNFFNPSSNGQNALLEKALEYGSQHGLLAYYSFQKKRGPALILRQGWRAPANYFSYTEAVIPKGVRPKEFVYWEIMGKKIMPWPVEIRRIMPKPKFLKRVNWPKDI